MILAMGLVLASTLLAPIDNAKGMSTGSVTSKIADYYSSDIVACYRFHGKSLCYKIIEVLRGRNKRVELVVNPCEVDGHEPPDNKDCMVGGVAFENEEH